MESRKQFTFYRSYYDAIRMLPKKDRADVLLAVCAYALDGEKPDLNGTASAIFTLILPTLDVSRRKSENGSRGGKTKQTASKPQANSEQGENPSEKEKEKEGEIEIEKEVENECYLPPISPLQGENAADKPPQTVRFSPPTVEEVWAYCQERQNGIDAQTFVDFYAAKGWMIGKNRMKDWRAAVRTWEKGEKGGRSPQSAETGTKTSNPFLALLNERRKEHGDDI